MKASCLVVAALSLLVVTSCHHHLRHPKVAKESSEPAPHGPDASLDAPWSHVENAGGVAPDPFTGKCAIRTHEDSYYGFKIGYPAGWRIDYSTDTIVVAKDETQLEGALVFPARLRRRDVPAERLATLFAQGLARTIVRRGGTFQLTEQKTDGKVATAMILATVNGVALKGPLRVVEKPGFVILRLYWAPADQFDADEATLKQVLACYDRKTVVTAKRPAAPPGGTVTKIGFASKPTDGGPTAAVQPLRPYRGRFMNMSLPAGWQVADEGENGIDVISADKKAGVGFGWFINPQSGQDPVSLLRENVTKYHPGARVLRSGSLPAPPGWTVVAAEFEGGGAHGVSRVAEGRGMATMSMWDCEPARWAALRPTLEAIAASVQVTAAAQAQVNADVRQQLASYPHPEPATASSDLGSSSASSAGMASWDSPGEDGETRQQRDMDDYIRGNERATSPTTGEEYVVPTSAWNADGPQGAGYYLATPAGGAELLNVEPPPGESAPSE